MALKFKKNESFYIRDGWFEKAINSIAEREANDLSTNIFYKNDGIEILGIGSNMVKSLKYWLQSSNVITKSSNSCDLTEFGKLLFINDPYLDDKFSWFLIHYFLVISKEECPIYHYVFNGNIKKFKKTEMSEFLKEKIKDDGEEANPKYVDEDANVFLKSYVADSKEANPEENYVCPLASLKLLSYDKGTYSKTGPRHSELSPLIVFFVLEEAFNEKPFTIEDSFEQINGPVKVFNLEKSSYLQYLDELRHLGYITINKTAGLNTVYFEKAINLAELFKNQFMR